MQQIYYAMSGHARSITWWPQMAFGWSIKHWLPGLKCQSQLFKPMKSISWNKSHSRHQKDLATEIHARRQRKPPAAGNRPVCCSQWRPVGTLSLCNQWGHCPSIVLRRVVLSHVSGRVAADRSCPDILLCSPKKLISNSKFQIHFFLLHCPRQLPQWPQEYSL